MRRATIFLAAPFAVLVAAGACNRKDTQPAAAAGAKPAEAVPPSSDPAEPNEYVGAGGSAADATPGAGSASPPPTERGGTTAATSGDVHQGAPGTSGAAASTGAPPADPKALLSKVRSKRTKDDEARELLAQAEAAGASPHDLARAANKRGQALFASPERAQAFYAWAAEKDPTYALPMFNLAKLSVMQGDVPTTIERLQEVAKRKGGRKLLDQIGFDPTWEIVKDDPEVRKLLR